MASRAHHLNVDERRREKQAAREAAERALRSGGAQAVAAKRRCEAFASIAVYAVPDLPAARSLS